MTNSSIFFRPASALWFASTLLAAPQVSAADEKSAESGPWKGAVELGYISTSGNTETQTSAFKADLTYEVAQWRHTGHAEAYGSQAENDAGESAVSAERYQLTGKSDYKFNEHNYMFGLVDLNKDRFSGFEYEHKISAGYGRKVIKQTAMELDLEVGPGVRFFKEDNRSSDESGILRLAGNYWWKIADNSKFSQVLNVEIGEVITSTESITGLEASIINSLALKATYTVRNKSSVPAETEKTDTEIALTLIYNY